MTVCPFCQTENPDGTSSCNRCGQYITEKGSRTGQLDPDTVLENRYVIVRTIGRGGMGAVYQALDTRLNNMPVAIKEMSTNAMGKDNLQAAIAAFKKEATILSTLKHPSLPVIRDFFTRDEERWYLVMDYIEGETLKEIAQRRGQIPDVEVLDWARQLCDILDYLHNQNPPVIFRDLKPANIMLTHHGQIKLIDFGIARHFKPETSVDTSAYGSAGFAPPEQYGRNQTDQRSDIYALGATLHYLLTGQDPTKRPFHFDPPSRWVKVSPALEKAVMRAVQLNPEERPSSAREMKTLLDYSIDDQYENGTAAETVCLPAGDEQATKPVAFPDFQEKDLLRLAGLEKDEKSKIQVSFPVNSIKTTTPVGKPVRASAGRTESVAEPPFSADKNGVPGGLIMAGVVCLFLWVVTLAVFQGIALAYQVNGLGFSAGYVCFVELIAVSYAALLFTPHWRRRIAPAILAALGVVVGLYVSYSLAMVVNPAHWIKARVPLLHFTEVFMATAVFLGLSSLLIWWGMRQQKEEMEIGNREATHRQVLDLSARVNDSLQSLDSLTSEGKAAMQNLLSMIKPRILYGTPFGRPESQVVELEMGILEYLNHLERVSCQAIEGRSGEEEINNYLKRLLQMLERRERLLVK